MNVTKVSVSYGETQSLASYCNVKFHITLDAELTSSDELADSIDRLHLIAQKKVQGQVDDALEADGQPAKWSQQPRFKLRYSKARGIRIFAIFPDGQSVPDDFFNCLVQIPDGIRLSHLQRLLQQRIAATPKDEKYLVIDCSDGDLSRLPALQEDAEPEIELDTAGDIDEGGQDE